MSKSSRFQYKLWDVVNKCQSGAIRWSKIGDSIIFNFDKFKKEYLDANDNFCKSKNLNSLVRQLNLYGFRKLCDLTAASLKENDKEYSNAHFLRGRPDLLQFIRRAKTAQPNRKIRITKTECASNEESDESYKPGKTLKRKMAPHSNRRRHHKKRLKVKSSDCGSAPLPPPVKGRRGRPRKRPCQEMGQYQREDFASHSHSVLRPPLSDVTQHYKHGIHARVPELKSEEDLFPAPVQLLHKAQRPFSTYASEESTQDSSQFYSHKIFPSNNLFAANSRYSASEDSFLQNSSILRQSPDFRHIYVPNGDFKAENAESSFSETPTDEENAAVNVIKFTEKQIASIPTESQYLYLNNHGDMGFSQSFYVNTEDTQGSAMLDKTSNSGIQYLSLKPNRAHAMQSLLASNESGHLRTQPNLANWMFPNNTPTARVQYLQPPANSISYTCQPPNPIRTQALNKKSVTAVKASPTEIMFPHTFRTESDDEWPDKSNLKYSALVDEFEKGSAIYKYGYSPNMMMSYGFYGVPHHEKNARDYSFMDCYGRHMYTG